MRTLTVLTTLVIVLSIGACTPTVDMEAEKAAIEDVLEAIEQANHDKNATAYVSNLDEGALICGTDPEEFWTKAAVAEEIDKMFSDETFNSSWDVNVREIILAEGGTTAVAYEQASVDYISEFIQVRCVYHLVKRDTIWLVDFLSLALIPQNEDIPNINSLFEVKEL